MPTGYTNSILEGASFEEYARRCMRAFGPLHMMSDEPLDAKLPQEIEPSNYHAEQLKEIEVEFKKFQDIPEEELRNMYEKEKKEHEDRAIEWNQERSENREKYESVLEKAKAYKAPSKDHEGFKNFMISQIEECIDWECRPYIPDTFSEFEAWKIAKEESFEEEVSYHQKEFLNDQEDARRATEWIQSALKSLENQQ